MEIQEIIVVEGRSDTRRLKEVFPNIKTIETRGSAIDQQTLDVIREAERKRGVIIFTDPDYQGQRIRTIINQQVPGCKNAYIDKVKAISVDKHKVGVEHASDEDLKHALTNLTYTETGETLVTMEDLFSLKAIGHENSQHVRNFISLRLHLGMNNGKQFYNKLKMFRISKETLLSLLAEYEGENNG